MHNCNEITQRCPQIHVSPTSKYQFSERHGKQYESELAVKLHAKIVEVGNNVNKNHRQDQVTMGSARSPESTND